LIVLLIVYMEIVMEQNEADALSVLAVVRREIVRIRRLLHITPPGPMQEAYQRELERLRGMLNW
jgi:hypothetical protein